MTYQSIQEIEDAYLEPENEFPLRKKRIIISKNQAIERFNKRQQKSSENQKSSETITNNAKRKSREVLTDEQRTDIQVQDKKRKRQIKTALTEQNSNIQE